LRLLSSLFERSFAHGVHPHGFKEQTEDLPIQRVPFGQQYVMPLGQHIGVPAKPVVSEGQEVHRGQLIAEPGGFVSTALHSPVTGKITKIGDQDFDRFEPSDVTKAIVLGTANELTVNRGGNITKVPIDPKFQKYMSKASNARVPLFVARMPFEIAEISGDQAREAGLQVGDRIVSLDGEPTPYYHNFRIAVRQYKGQNVEIGYERDGRDFTTNIQLSEEGRLGVYSHPEDYFYESERLEYSFLEAMPAGVDWGVSFLREQFTAFGQMFKGKINPNETLGGFGTITKLFPETWQWESFWYVTALLSLILGFMNLLPIPALDGGHVMFLIYEVLSGRKPSDKFMEYATLAGFAIVLTLVVYANGLDVWRWISGN